MSAAFEFQKLTCYSLVGMAFRMGQDLGFHQDPRRWEEHDQSISSATDIEIRRRVYWGCYIADKYAFHKTRSCIVDLIYLSRIISLYLGRPVCLHEGDAAVNPTDVLP